MQIILEALSTPFLKRPKLSKQLVYYIFTPASAMIRTPPCQTSHQYHLLTIPVACVPVDGQLTILTLTWTVIPIMEDKDEAMGRNVS